MELEERIIRAIDKIEGSSVPLAPFELFGIEHGYGWYGLTLPVIEEIRRYNEKNPGDKITITQIKEKWGSLNIHISGGPGYIYSMIRKAERESRHICEICGARGASVEINGWYWTLCGDHAKIKQLASYDHELEERLYIDLLDSRKGEQE